MSSRRRQTGRIQTAQRDTNDATTLLGDNGIVEVQHQKLVRNTEKLEINLKL